MSVQGITPHNVAKKVFQREPLFILDVRQTDAFEEWKIEGDKVESMNIPYFDLLDGVEEILSQLPSDQEVLVVCAKEGSSIMVGDMLVEAGVKAVYLEGGMKAWSEVIEPIKIADLTNGGSLHQFVRLGKGCLSYMIVSEGEAVVIDPARLTNVYTDFAKKQGARITHVIDTHLHADHISGGRALAEQTGAVYFLPPADATDVTFAFSPIKEGNTIEVGQSKIAVQAVASPGHTIGSTSFIIDDAYLLTGDILFIDSIGRPDLAGRADDWVGDLRDSLYQKYQALSADLLVLPAHFMGTDELNRNGSVSEKLGTLFEQNHGLQVEDEQVFRKLVTDNLPPQPNAYQEIRETNMGKRTPDQETQQEMEVGPNRCAVR